MFKGDFGGNFVLAVLWAVGGCFVRAFVLMKMWGWFVAPVTGWAVIGMGEALAFTLILSMFLPALRKQQTLNSKEFSLKFDLTAPIVLIVGWLIHLMM